MTLLYAFVARDDVILSEHAQCSGNFSEVAMDCLAKFESQESRFTLRGKEHLLNFLVQDGFTYLVVSEENYPREICFYFLEQVQSEFQPKHGAKGKTAAAHSLDRQFGSRLKYHMEYCINNPGEISKIHRVKAKVDEVKGIMVQNIEKVLERGERIEVLVDKTEDLQNQAQRFQVQGRNLRNKMWWQNMKVKVLVVAAILLLLIIIFCSFCFAGGNNCIG
eukprot:jgi/Ulvmu1/11777/UM008_0191.1